MEALRDEQLMSDVLAGDERAFNALVERHYRPLLGYLFASFTETDNSLKTPYKKHFYTCCNAVDIKPVVFLSYDSILLLHIIRDYFKSAVVKHGANAADEILLAMYDPAPGPEDSALSESKERLFLLL